MLTKEEVVRAMPASLKSSVTQNLVDTVNTAVQDPIVADAVRENFIHYAGVLKDGKFKTEDYLNAVMYVSYKHMNYSNEDAYAKTFPQRYHKLIAAGTSKKVISSYVSMYNKGKLVNAILEQTMIPIWVLNQHAVQKAINTQIEIMEDSSLNAIARAQAANSILTHLKKPESVKGQLDINITDNSGMNELKNTLEQLAQRQREAIESGMSAREIASTPIIEGEVISE